MQVIEEKGYKYLPGEKIAELCMDSDDGLMTIIYFKDESGLMSFELHQDGELGKCPENWNVLEEQLAQLFIELRIPDDDLIPYDEMVSSTEYEDTATTLREFYVRKI